MTRQEAALVLQRNCELLRHTFNTLQTLSHDLRKQKTGLGYCNAVTLSAASKTVYERFEAERRALAALGATPKSVVFVPPAKLGVPEGLSEEVAKAATCSDFYKVMMGKLGAKDS